MATRAYKVTSLANSGKDAQVFALLTPWRTALNEVTDYAYRHFTLQGKPVPKRFSLRTMNLETPLSARQINSVWVQAFGGLSSWETRIQAQYKAYVAHSNLDEFTKITLYRINKYRAWFNTSLALPMWADEIGELTHVKAGEKIEWDVSADILHLSRHIARQSIRKQPLPDFLKVNTMLMDGTVANLEKTKNTQDIWLRISTLKKGKPTLVPIKLNKYTNKRTGQWNNGVQIIIRNNQAHYALTKTLPDTEPRETGADIGLDWGLVNLFTDSRGNQYGQALYSWLKERDQELTNLTSALQKQGVKPSQSKRYKMFNKRISEYVKNEVNRVLNKLASQDIRSLAVESLDFRHSRLSPRMNRLLTRAGRGAIRTKLKDLTELSGITIHTINPAYTSQECSKCGWVSKINRKTQTNFQCTKCDWSGHADVNAARNILGRSQSGDAWLYVKRDIIRERLLVRYSEENTQRTPSTVRLADTPPLTRESSQLNLIHEIP